MTSPEVNTIKALAWSDRYGVYTHLDRGLAGFEFGAGMIRDTASRHLSDTYNEGLIPSRGHQLFNNISERILEAGFLEGFISKSETESGRTIFDPYAFTSSLIEERFDSDHRDLAGSYLPVGAATFSAYIWGMSRTQRPDLEFMNPESRFYSVMSKAVESDTDIISWRIPTADISKPGAINALRVAIPLEGLRSLES